MGIQMHCYRRGATYQWRKRLPASLGGAILQISLRTNDPLIARRLALILGAESCEVFDAMQNGLSRDDAKRLLEGVIRRELDKILKRRLVALEINTGISAEEDRKQDHLAAFVHARLAERGVTANPLNTAEIEQLANQGFGPSEINQAKQHLEAEVQAYSQAPSQGLNSRSTRAMREILERNDFTQWELMDGRQLYHKALSQAYDLSSNTKDIEILRAAMEPVAKPSPTIQPPEPPRVAPPPPTNIAPAKRPRGRPRKEEIVAENGYDPRMPALIKRLMEQKRRQKMSAQMILQMTRMFEQFADAISLKDIRDLKQAHLSRYVDILHELPKNYGKSSRDHGKSVAQILKEATKLSADQRGLSPSTINRNLDYLGQLISKAKSEGFDNVLRLDLGSLRPRKSHRDRDDRPAFTPEDVQKLFQHPLWQGNLLKNKWQQPGPHIVKDGMYWVPMIAALTGARREEIAALKAADIIEINGIVAFRIHENDNRGVKTFASERIVPLHPQLIEQGLCDHASQLLASDPAADLFPDLKRKDGFGKSIQYKFSLITAAQLDGNPEQKVFHSFRHYVATMLGQLDGVREQTRKDILGHVGASITEERYTATTTLQVKLDAISKLPRLPLPQ